MSDSPSSFDSLAHEHNLSPRLRDLARLFFKAGLEIGRRQALQLRDVASEPARSGPVGRLPGEQPARVYDHVLDRDTAPGEFR